jgi:hypothetical protein
MGQFYIWSTKLKHILTHKLYLKYCLCYVVKFYRSDARYVNEVKTRSNVQRCSESPDWSRNCSTFIELQVTRLLLWNIIDPVACVFIHYIPMNEWMNESILTHFSTHSYLDSYHILCHPYTLQQTLVIFSELLYSKRQALYFTYEVLRHFTFVFWTKVSQMTLNVFVGFSNSFLKYMNSLIIIKLGRNILFNFLRLFNTCTVTNTYQYSPHCHWTRTPYFHLKTKAALSICVQWQRE